LKHQPATPRTTKEFPPKPEGPVPTQTRSASEGLVHTQTRSASEGPVPTHTRSAHFRVSRFCESRSDGRHKPSTSVRGNSEERADSPGRDDRLIRTRFLSSLPGLWDVDCFWTMDLRPWLSHVMPPAFKSATSKSVSNGCPPPKPEAPARDALPPKPEGRIPTSPERHISFHPMKRPTPKLPSRSTPPESPPSFDSGLKLERIGSRKMSPTQ